MQLSVSHKYSNRIKWDLCHRIINTVRTAKGLPPTGAANPYKEKKPKEGTETHV